MLFKIPMECTSHFPGDPDSFRGLAFFHRVHRKAFLVKHRMSPKVPAEGEGHEGFPPPPEEADPEMEMGI